VWDVIADFFSEKHSEDVLDALLKHLTARRMEAIASASWVSKDSDPYQVFRRRDLFVSNLRPCTAEPKAQSTS
jgi:hypothetical protein